MMKTDASAAQIFLVLKKAFLPHLPLNKKNSLKFFRISKNTSSPLPSHPPPLNTLVFQLFQVVQKKNIGLSNHGSLKLLLKRMQYCQIQVKSLNEHC